MSLDKTTRPKSKRQRFGALLGRAFHMELSLSKGMPFDIIFSLRFEKMGAVKRPFILHYRKE